MATINEFGFIQEYMLDAWQRSILMLDVLRQRGNNYQEHNEKNVPHVLQFKAELIRDGRTLKRPVNYLLVRITPPKGAKVDPSKPPFIIVDPRAGHGPGIGGMKADSEIGVAINAGHTCYYIGFLPEPVPGQTIEDVCVAEAAFVKEVAALHRDADGKPVIVANCQAGWQIMMMAALNPELAGPIMLAGSPLSYWAGVHGKNPMRYLGGLLGGSWLTALTGDTGNGIFDGANLVANFESQNPANTNWEKLYNVYSKVDTEAKRFLDFETWWGSPVLMNTEEMEWIADNLFIGNKLSSGELRMSDGKAIDLRKIQSPIIVFCSWGDNITPPQQALHWITDLYNDETEIIENGQTIVYTMHQDIGHLGIFVSGKVATKEHQEFAQCMEMINMVAPGLYEAVITEATADMPGREFIEGKYLFELKRRTLDDIRALGENSPADNQCFATAARVSELNKSLYETFAAPVIRAITTEKSAKKARDMHPSRLGFAMFSDQNPLMKPVAQYAKTVQEERAPVSANNPLLTIEKAMSNWITASWEAHMAVRDTMGEMAFMNAYSSPLLQAAVGVTAKPADQSEQRKKTAAAGKARLRSQLEDRFEFGGLIEAFARALNYVNRPQGSVDERSFHMLKKLREARPAEIRRSLAEIKEILKEQALLIRLDEERAIKALPKLLPKSKKERQDAFDAIGKLLKVRGAISKESQERLDRIEILFVGNKNNISTTPHLRVVNG